jgi:hypothetical protein
VGRIHLRVRLCIVGVRDFPGLKIQTGGTHSLWEGRSWDHRVRLRFVLSHPLRDNAARRMGHPFSMADRYAVALASAQLHALRCPSWRPEWDGGEGPAEAAPGPMRLPR